MTVAAVRALGPLLLVVAGLASCERASDTTATRPDARATAAPALPAPPPPPPTPPRDVDPGDFARNGCATDAMPPHIVAGTARVAFLPFDGQGAFRYVHLPARCGTAYPGQQLPDGTRSRPGDGAEFVVCMPDDQRLDIGVLRRGRVPAGDQDVGHVANLVRLRLGVVRDVNYVVPAGTSEAVSHLTFGAGLHSARGFVRLRRDGTNDPVGAVDFAIDCAGR